MITNLYFIISIISLAIAGMVCGFFYLTGGKPGLEGAAWILALLGAPTTLLTWIPYKMGLSQGVINGLFWIIFFYLLQYQIIGIIFSRKNVKFVYLLILITILLISARIVWKIIMGPLAK